MTDSKLFKSFLITLFGVGIMEVITIKLYLFLTIFWFDMVMHFFGGFLVSMFIVWILTWHGKKVSYGQMLLWGVGGAVVIGVLWECFEVYFGMTSLSSPLYLQDNGMDVVMDTTGGLVAVLYSYIKIRTSKFRQSHLLKF
jgi:hypothetical protein